MFRSTLITLLAALALGVCTAAALGGNPKDPGAGSGFTTQETIDLDAFAQGIEDRLDGHVVGYSYAIARNGAVVRSGAGGYRRLAVDGAPALFTTSTMAQTASAAKTVSAAALIKALHEHGLSVDDRLWRYLPRCWHSPHAPSKSIRKLTFRQLLGHHSRLEPAPGTACSSDPLGCLRRAIEQGRIGTKDYEYQNLNYALVRVILPFVLSQHELRNAFDHRNCDESDGALNELVSSRFRDYVFDEVLSPLGVHASFYPQGDGVADYALNYNNADHSQPGGVPREDFYLHAGAGYLAVSASDYVRFLSALDAGLILPKALADEMKGVPGNRMGFDTSIAGTLGAYVWKNGGCPSHNGTKPGCSTLAVVFPNGMQAYVAINSSNNTYKPLYGGLDEVIRDAFDESLL